VLSEIILESYIKDLKEGKIDSLDVNMSKIN